MGHQKTRSRVSVRRRRKEGLGDWREGTCVNSVLLHFPHAIDLVFIHMKTTGNWIKIRKKTPNILRFSLIYKEIV